MKKFVSLCAFVAALSFVSCGGNTAKVNQDSIDSVKADSIAKAQADSLASQQPDTTVVADTTAVADTTVVAQ